MVLIVSAEKGYCQTRPMSELQTENALQLVGLITLSNEHGLSIEGAFSNEHGLSTEDALSSEHEVSTKSLQ